MKRILAAASLGILAAAAMTSAAGAGEYYSPYRHYYYDGYYGGYVYRPFRRTYGKRARIGGYTGRPVYKPYLYSGTREWTPLANQPAGLWERVQGSRFDHNLIPTR